jgi:hypothetical protein
MSGKLPPPPGHRPSHPLAGGIKHARQRKARKLAAIQRRYGVVTRFLELVQHKDPAPQLTIARELGVHKSQVTRVLDAAYRDWQLLCADTVDRIVDQSIEEFAWIKAQAQEQWERSKRDVESTVTEQIADVGADTPDPTTKPKGAGKRVKVQKTVKAQCGDPRYLQTILDACDKLIRLTVGYQPTKVAGTLEVTDPRRALAELLGIAPERLPAGADGPAERQ